MVRQVNVNKLTGKGAAKGVAGGLIKVAILDVMSRWCVDKKNYVTMTLFVATLARTPPYRKFALVY